MKEKLMLATIFLCLAVGTSTVFAADLVNMNMNVNSGLVAVTTNGIDSSVWHPGIVGQSNSLTAVGGFSGTYVVDGGNYGALGSYVNLGSKESGASFVLADTQDFNVLSANWNTNVIGNFLAQASGNNGQVAMNLKSIGSMYVWSEATNPYWNAPLQGSLISKEVWTTKNGEPNTDLYLGVSTTGIATMSNSNIWGWCNGATGTSDTNYGGGTRSVSASGDGTFLQSGFGANSLTFNGITFGAGSFVTTGSFTGGLGGTYSMSAS